MDREKVKNKFLKESKKLKEEELLKVLQYKEEIISKVCNNFDLKDFVEEVNIFFMMVEDFINKRCDISIDAIKKIGWTLFYILEHLDSICDTVPIVGYIDDAFIVNVCLDNVKEEIDNYKNRCLKGKS